MRRLVLSFLAATICASPAAAEVFQKADNGFIIRAGADVTAPPDIAWRTLVDPSGWWSSDHTWSGDAANLSIDPRVQGCFCEVLPDPDSSSAAPRGHVEHMRVILVDRGRMLRLSGALGPLQPEAVTGTLTINLKLREGGGTRLLWEYVVGGYMRQKTEDIAPAVDKVINEQLARLAGKLGPVTLPPVAAPSDQPPASPAGPPADTGKPVIIGR